MDYKNKFEKHIAVLAFPFATHPGLLLGLLRKLANASPKSIIFSFFSTSKSNASLFSIKSSPSDQNGDENIKAFDVADGVPEGYKFMGRPQEDIDLFLEVAEENFKKGVEEAEKAVGIKVSCVVADAFLWFSGEMAAELKVPWIPVWTSGANSLSVHVYTELIRQKVGLDGVSGREDEILTFVPGFPELRLGDLPSGVVLGRLESPFSIMLYKMGQILPKLAHALPMNSFEELDPPILKDLKSNFKNVLNIGPFNLTSPPPSANISDVHGCIPWLDNHKTGQVAYIGFGTVASPPPHELKAMAEALEATKIPFIWSLKENMKPHLPEGFIERTSETGKVVPWAPQVQILSHDSVGVFLNHCGWNSVLESIAAGVPIISRPFFGDHQINTWMVEKVWKIGVRIQGGSFTKDATINAIDLVLKREEGKRLKDQIVSYKKLVMEAVGPNGSSTKNFETLVKIINKP